MLLRGADDERTRLDLLGSLAVPTQSGMTVPPVSSRKPSGKAARMPSSVGRICATTVGGVSSLRMSARTVTVGRRSRCQMMPSSNT